MMRPADPDEQVAYLRRFVAQPSTTRMHEEKKRDAEAWLAYLDANSVEGVEPMIEVVFFNCMRCQAPADIPAVVFDRRGGEPLCDACHYETFDPLSSRKD